MHNVCCQTKHAIHFAATTKFFSRHFSDVSNMNEGNSAGGGHEGLSPAPPAVSDRVTLQSTEKSVTTPKSTASTTSHNNKSTAATTQHLKTSKQQQQQLLSAQLPVPLSNLSTEATAAATSAAASIYSTSVTTAEVAHTDSTVIPPQAKRQRLENTETVGDQSSSSTSSNNNSNIVGAVSSNIVGSLLPASVVASSEVGGANSSGLQDLNALRKRILQQKYQNLRNLKERYVHQTIFCSSYGFTHISFNNLQTS